MMLLHDLYDKVSTDKYLNTVNTKLNNTLVKFKGSWWVCYYNVTVDNYSYDKSTILQLNKYKEKTINIKVLSEVDTEPVWPQAAHYNTQCGLIEVSYKHTNSYKAGLPNSRLLISPKNLPEHIEDTGDYSKFTPFLLDNIEKEIPFPSLQEGTELLLSQAEGGTYSHAIPIHRHTVIGVHPYVDAPVLLYKGTIIGSINANQTVRPVEKGCMTELLETLGDLE